MSPGRRPSQFLPMPDQSNAPITTSISPARTRNFPRSFIFESARCQVSGIRQNLRTHNLALGTSHLTLFDTRQFFKALLNERRALNAREPGVKAVQREQFIVRAALDNFAVADHK